MEKLYYWTETFSWQARSITGEEHSLDITVATSPAGLCWLDFSGVDQQGSELPTWAAKWFKGWQLERKQEPNESTMKELREYFAGTLKEFTAPLHQVGTPFQIKVWQELCRIPYGVTCSYVDIAEKVGCPKGSRAVGLANSKNPIGIVVPCHRVIGKNGKLTGYAGGLDKKQMLLELEGALA